MFGRCTKFVFLKKWSTLPRLCLGWQSISIDNQNTLPHSSFSKSKVSINDSIKPKQINISKFLDSDGKSKILERENIWTIPNILCLTRICFSPYLGILIYQEQFNLAFYVMIFAGITDLLDGFIARNFSSQASKFGSFLDPLADKILITTTCVTLTCVNIIPIPLTLLIVSRDLTLAASGFYIRYKSLPPPKTLARYFDATHATVKLEPTKISKFNTIVQLAAISVGLMSPVLGFVGHPSLFYLWCFTGMTTVASGIISSAVTYLIVLVQFRTSEDIANNGTIPFKRLELDLN